MKEFVQLKKAIIHKPAPDVLMTSYKSDVHITEEDAMEIDQAHLTMAQGSDMFVLVDLAATNPGFDKAAEDYFVHKGKMIPFTKAIAIVTEHKSSFFARVFGVATRTLYPTKEFDSIEKATVWFDSLRK